MSPEARRHLAADLEATAERSRLLGNGPARELLTTLAEAVREGTEEGLLSTVRGHEIAAGFKSPR